MTQLFKVLVVDDAAFMVKAISELLQTDPQIEIVGVARNGLEGLQQIKQLRPDVITLDMDMPVMDGLTAIRHIMIEAPVPIVVLSSLSKNGAITFEALRLGIVDFMPKPSGAISKDIHQSKQQLLDRVKIAAAVNIENVRRVKLAPQNTLHNLSDRYAFQSLDYVLVAGTTLGGPNTSLRLLSRLAPSLPAAIVVTQDIAPEILPAFAKRFDEHVPWRVEAAQTGMALEQGTCYVASNQRPATLYLNAEQAPCLQLADPPQAQPLNRLFSTAAEVFGSRTIGLLMSGTGEDGSAGFLRIKECAGITLAQQTNTCVYPNLTQHAIEQQVVDQVIEERDLAAAIEAVMVAADSSDSL